VVMQFISAYVCVSACLCVCGGRGVGVGGGVPTFDASPSFKDFVLGDSKYPGEVLKVPDCQMVTTRVDWFQRQKWLVVLVESIGYENAIVTNKNVTRNN